MQENVQIKKEEKFEERKTIYMLLMVAGGMMGAYTYVLRGGVFCNAQTGNMLMMAISAGNGKWWHTLYYFIPMAAYFFGAFVSELLRNPIKTHGHKWWNPILVTIEMLVLFGVGFIPLSMPDQIVQILVNFICSMQYNTFRQARGIPMSTTFCTNHVRQVGIWMAHYKRHRDLADLKRCLVHVSMLACFVLGGAAVTAFANLLGSYASWLTLIPLSIVLILLLEQEFSFHPFHQFHHVGV